MPANKHIQFFDITDFTPGLWDERGTQSLVAPQNSLAICQDYYPLKQGGLRAMYRPIAVGNSGIGATEECMGVYARNGVATRPGKTGGGADSFDAICVTIDTVDFKVRFYRMDQSNDETTWKTIFTSVATSNAGHQCTGFAFFQRTDGTIVYLISVAVNSVAVSGLYTVGYATGTAGVAPDNVVTRLQAFGGPLEVSQARVLIGGGNDNVLHYSDVGDTSFTSLSGQKLAVTPNRSESNLSIISGIEPSDLLVGKEGAPWVSISGDISSISTAVREMGNAAHQRQNKQQVPQVPGGIAFIEGGGRVYITDGRSFNSISDPLRRFALAIDHMVGTGGLALLNAKLFAPGGYVYDFDTQAWFKQAGLSNSTWHWADPYGGMMWAAQHGTGFDIKRFLLYESFTNNGNRVSTGTIQTQPFTDAGGRAVEIREVQLYVRGYATTSYVCTLIDRTGSVVATNSVNSAVSADERQVKFLFPNVQDEYLSVNIVPTATGTTEAPTIERLRVGFGPGNAIN